MNYKVTLLLVIAFFISKVSFSQHISLDSAAFYEGKTVTICALVKDTHQSNGERKTTYINFGKPYPNSTFVVVIFEDNLAKFKYNPSAYLLEKNICVKGTIKMYKGKPEMIISSPDEIEIQAK